MTPLPDAIEARIQELKRTHDRNDNPNVFSEWSFREGYSAKSAQNDEALKTIAGIAIGVLETANNRSLDWDMMHQKESLRLLQQWRGECLEAIATIERIRSKGC